MKKGDRIRWKTELLGGGDYEGRIDHFGIIHNVKKKRGTGEIVELYVLFESSEGTEPITSRYGSATWLFPSDVEVVEGYVGGRA